MKGNILILSEPFGGGHTKVAEALAMTLKGWNCTVCELGNYLQPRLTSYINKGYLTTVRRAPWLWGKIYTSSLSESSVIPYLYRKVYFSKLATLLLQSKPDLILATHPLPASAIGSLRKYKIRIPIVGITTDFHIHPSWSLTDWDYLCAPCPEIPEWLQDHTKLLTTGIPVRPTFYRKRPKEEVKLRYLFNEKNPVILWMGGSEGIYKRMEWIQNLEHDPSIQWIFVTGRNVRLYKKLQESIGHLPHVRVFGYVQDIAGLMDAADLLITKPGGVSCSEAIQKEVPMLLSQGITGQEEENTSFLLRLGLAEQITDENTWEAAKVMIHQPYRRECIRTNMKRYKKSIHPNQLLSLIESLAVKGKFG
jgi:processive 1,2-diacylglycerol beta-glucosyltransferase